MNKIWTIVQIISDIHIVMALILGSLRVKYVQNNIKMKAAHIRVKSEL